MPEWVKVRALGDTFELRENPAGLLEVKGWDPEAEKAAGILTNAGRAPVFDYLAGLQEQMASGVPFDDMLRRLRQDGPPRADSISAAAAQRAVSAGFLAVASHSWRQGVRAAVAANPNTPTFILSRLLHNDLSHHFIAEGIGQQIRRLSKLDLEYAVTQRQAAHVARQAATVLDDPDLIARLLASAPLDDWAKQDLAANPNTPPELIRHLVMNPSSASATTPTTTMSLPPPPVTRGTSSMICSKPKPRIRIRSQGLGDRLPGDFTRRGRPHSGPEAPTRARRAGGGENPGQAGRASPKRRREPRPRGPSGG